MQQDEEALLTPTKKRSPLLAVMGLLPEMKSGRTKTSVILITLLLVCIGFLGFRYWALYQLNDRYQRHIAFLERGIYKNSRDEDNADRREKDFQQELKKQKDKLVQMNSELARVSSKWQQEKETLMQTVDSKNAVIKRNGEILSHLKKDYENLQEHMASFQVNQSQLLEKFTAQSVKVEMLIKLKDACYAQMRSLGQRVSIPAQKSPGQSEPAKDRPDAGTPARESAERVQLKPPLLASQSAKVLAPVQESRIGATHVRESVMNETLARDSPKAQMPARESPGKGVSSRESPAGATQGRQVEKSAQDHSKDAESAPKRPIASSKAGQSSVNEKPKKDDDAASVPALKPSNPKVPVWPPQLGKEHPEKGNIEVQKQKKATSDDSALKDNKDFLPLMKKDDKVSAGGSVKAPNNKNLPNSQPKENQNNEKMKEKEEEEDGEKEVLPYIP